MVRCGRIVCDEEREEIDENGERRKERKGEALTLQMKDCLTPLGMSNSQRCTLLALIGEMGCATCIRLQLFSKLGQFFFRDETNVLRRFDAS